MTCQRLEIKWLPQPIVTDPAKLTATVAAIVPVLGTAQIELARRAAGLLAPEPVNPHQSSSPGVLRFSDTVSIESRVRMSRTGSTVAAILVRR